MALRNASNIHNFGFPPSSTALFILAAAFTRWFVNPAVDPAGATVVVVLIVLVVLTVLVGLVVLVVVALIVVIHASDQASESCEGVVSIVSVATLPLTSFGRVRLDDVKYGYEIRAKVWGSSERAASNAMKVA